MDDFLCMEWDEGISSLAAEHKNLAKVATKIRQRKMKLQQVAARTDSNKEQLLPSVSGCAEPPTTHVDMPGH